MKEDVRAEMKYRMPWKFKTKSNASCGVNTQALARQVREHAEIQLYSKRTSKRIKSERGNTCNRHTQASP